VNESALVPAELEAIAAAIREVALPQPRAQARAQTRPIPLPPADRAMSIARAALLELASLWAEAAPRLLKAQLPGAWQVRVTDIELLERGAAGLERGAERPATGPSARGGWSAAGRSAEGGVLAVAVHGALIEAVAARRCGDQRGRGEPRRAPSPAALRLFDPTGQAILDSWLWAWKELGRGELRPTREPAELEEILARSALLRVELAWSGGVHGRCSVYVAPATLAPMMEPAPVDAHQAMARLAQVPVELRVELGRFPMSLEDLRLLQPGACFALPTFVDSRVPVFVGGVLKAWGAPVVHRGVLAVAIEEVIGGPPGSPGDDGRGGRE
jgi:flagellar motor switch/type III secretory pathway protein FliN